MLKRRTIAIMLGRCAVLVAAGRHIRHSAFSRSVSGGILIGDAGVYDAMSRLLLGRFFAGIGADVASGVPQGAGCWRSGAGLVACRSCWLGAA